MTIMNDIRATLDDRLLTTPDLPEIAFQNVPYSHNPGISYIKVDYIPTSRRLATLGDTPQQRYQGIYRLLVCVPEKEGPGVGLNYVDYLLDRFPAAQDLSYNGQTVTIEYSEAGTGFLDSPFYCFPVTIAWYTYHA